MILGITGISGCGKTTLIKRLEQHRYTAFNYSLNPNAQLDKEKITGRTDDDEENDIKIINYFLNQRIEMFRHVRDRHDTKNERLCVDRWWLDTILNTTNMRLFEYYYEIYLSSPFSKDFQGAYIRTEPEDAVKRKDKYKLPELERQYRQFEIGLNWLSDRNYKIIIIDDKGIEQNEKTLLSMVK